MGLLARITGNENLSIGGGDPFGDKAAAEKQYEAQQQALAQQQSLADEMMARGDASIANMGQAADAAAYQLDEATRAANQSLFLGFEGATGALAGGRDAALGGLAGAYGQARGDISGGFRDAQGNLVAGYDRARGDLGTLQGLQRFGDSATSAIRSYDALGGRQDRVGGMLDQRGGLYGGFQEDPGYKFRQQQGEEAINRSASARGGRLSGRTMEALGQFNQDLASQEFANYAQRQNAQAGFAGASDASYNAILQGQAGRSDQAALAAQGNQMGLAGLGYGAQNTLAGMSAQQGQGLSGLSAQSGMALGNMAYGYGGQVAGIQGDYGQGLAGLYSQRGQDEAQQANLYGSQMAGLYTDTAANQANISIGVGTGNQNAMGDAYNQYAEYGGSVDQAAANSKREVVGGLLTLSDSRLKDKVETVVGSRYEAIGLRGARWVWNNQANKLGLFGKSDGVIAQEVREKYPQAVVADPDGWLTVDYGALDRLIAEAA